MIRFLSLITLFVAVVISSVSMATEPSKIYVHEKAVLKLCPKKMVPGCADRLILVDVAPKSYLVFEGATKEIQEELENIKGAYKFHNMSTTQPFFLTGVLTEKTGYMPNPMVVFPVMTIEKLEGVAIPK